MTEFLNFFGFLSVLLRALTLACESLAAGGVLFALACLRESGPEAWASCRRLIRISALGLAAAQLAFVSSDAYLLMATADLTLRDVATAGFFVAGCAAMGAGLFTALTVRWVRAGNWWTLAPAAVMLASSVMTSHAAARLDFRGQAVILTALHQSGTIAWIGGLPFLLIALARAGNRAGAEITGRRFSRMAQGSVAAILLSGLGLGWLYIGSAQALYGTAYGIMVLGKAAMFVALAGLGALNFVIVRALKRNPEPLLSRLKRLSEAEIVIGFTVILAAASLTSQPPAIDVRDGRAMMREIVERYTPRAPRLESPRFDQILVTPVVPSPEDFLKSAPRKRRLSNIAWSEYNHNWAGLVVLAMGLLAVASRVFGLRWARHWPLAFLGLALFLTFRADADAWPLGPRGFWASLIDPEILQHRLFALMVVAFAAFEWGVQVGRVRSKTAALVFPSICAVGGALLLTHSHSLGNVKEEYLAELSHVPIAILAVGAGSARWLEQRLDGGWRKIPSMIWPVCFVLIGLLLLFYREA